MLSRKTRNQFIQLVEKSVQPLGLFCREVEWVPQESVLRIYVEGSQPVSMEACVKASHAISELKELDEVIPGTYQLEVSSPGLEPPLRTAAHFKEAIGRWVKADVRNSLGKIDMVQGVLEEADEATIKLKDSKQIHEVCLDSVEFAKVLFKPDYSPKKKNTFVRKEVP